MVLSTQQIISLRAPQWANDPRMALMISYASEGLSPTNIGARYAEAVALKVLHIFAVEAGNGGNPGAGTSSGSGSAGMVSQERVGDVSKSYVYQGDSASNGGSISVDDYSSTQYGKELMKLLRSSTASFMTRRM